jgi:2-alkyl-3-oxoalkanoate reductase
MAEDQRLKAAIEAGLMRLLLTGGSGFLGSYVAEQLAEQGHTVRALVRPASDRKLLEKIRGLEFTLGAVEKRETLAEAVRGCEAVIHVAGLVKARTQQEFFEINTEGTKNLLEAAIAAGGVKRFVQVSSLAAIGPSHDGKPVADDAIPAPVTAYGRSKLAGEQAVLAAKDRIPVTVIRPPLVYGPRDRETLAFFTAIQRGTLPILGDGKNTLSVIYGADCAAAVVAAALGGGPSGRTYFVEDGEVYVWRDALGDVETALGKRAFLRAGVPMWTLKLAAAASQGWGKLTNTAQMLTLDKVNELEQPHWVCSGQGARKELGWSPKVKWPEGVKLAADWYRKEGWL